MCSGIDRPFELRPDDLDGPLPFHLLIDETLCIRHAGRSIRRLCPTLKPGDHLSTWITLERPAKPIEHLDDLRSIEGRLVLMRLAQCDVQLRGAFLPVVHQPGMMLAADPQLTAPEDLTTHGLHLNDFATHDAVTDLLFAIRARELTLNELREAMERQRSLVRELDHRVKNNITAVLSLIALTASEVSSIEEYHQRLDRRIRALDASHTLLARGGWGPVDFRTLAATVLNAFADPGDRLAFEGEDVRILARQAGPLALSLHELGINAAKYGGGWTEMGQGRLNWQEDGETLRVWWTGAGGADAGATPQGGGGVALGRGVF